MTSPKNIDEVSIPVRTDSDNEKELETKIEKPANVADETKNQDDSDETKSDTSSGSLSLPMMYRRYRSDEADEWIDSIDESTSVDELIKQSDKMIGLSIELSQPYSTNIQLEVCKEQLVKYLQTKIDKLHQRIRLVQHKYASYKKYNDGVNIGIILLSTTMTLLEAIKSEIGVTTLSEHTGASHFFSLSPVFISSTITCAAAIVKFKKFQEKMEGISKAVEKCVFAISRIKKCQEDIIFLKSQEHFEEIKERYQKDIYDYYSVCDTEIQSFLKTDDYGKYLKFLNELDINIMVLEKDKIKRERNIEQDFNKYMEVLNEKKRSKRNHRKYTENTCSNCSIM